MSKKPFTSWDSAHRWYDNLVGEKGHYYHQSVIVPNILRLLEVQEKKSFSLLDIGCGNGVLLEHLPKNVDYTGIDASKHLIEEAKRRKRGSFYVGDATQKFPFEKNDFDCAVFLLSLQNMQQGEGAIAQASKHLKKGGKLLLVLNHPCFRIPRQSDWGTDEKSKIQYRRMNLYMSSLEIPLETNPGKGAKSSVTYSFHHPLSTYFQWLTKNGFSPCGVEEWCSDKKSEGARAKAEDRARKEFPLFLAILSTKTEK